MKITEAISQVKNAEAFLNKKSIKKSQKEFIAVLTDLGNKELNEEQMTLIEQALDNLLTDVNFRENPKEITRKLNLFKTFLRDKLSITTPGYYTSMGIALGMCFGIVFGSVIEKFIGSSVGMIVGMAIGIIIGKKMDSKAEIDGRVLKTKLA